MINEVAALILHILPMLLMVLPLCAEEASNCRVNINVFALVGFEDEGTGEEQLCFCCKTRSCGSHVMGSARILRRLDAGTKVLDFDHLESATKDFGLYWCKQMRKSSQVRTTLCFAVVKTKRLPLA